MRSTYIGLVVGIGLFILSLLPRLSLINGAVSTKALFIILLVDLLAFLAIFLYLRKRKLTLKMGIFATSLLLLLFAQIASAIAGDNLVHSLLGDALRSTGLIFLAHITALAFLLGNVATPDDWKLVRRAVIFSAGTLALLTLIGAGGLGYSNLILWINLADLGVTFGNDTFLGIYFVLAVLMGIQEYIRTTNVRVRAGIFTAVVLISASPVLLNIQGVLNGTIGSVPDLLGSARASSAALWLAGVFAVGWWATTKITIQVVRRTAKCLWAGMFLLSFTAATTLLITPGSYLQQLLDDETMSARLIAWEIGVTSYFERPVLGWGYGNFNQAFEQNFDIRAYEHDGLIEPWFDKAHNFVIDAAVEGGSIGIIAGLFLLGAYGYVIIRSRRRNSISEAEALVLLILPVAHLTQLQTAFNTVSTYLLLGVAAGYALNLEREFSFGKKVLNDTRYLRIAALGVVIVSLVYYIGYEFPRQLSISSSLSEPNARKRAELITFGHSRLSDFEGLHRASVGFTDSVFEKLKEETNDEDTIARALPYLSQYSSTYELYLQKHSDYYRARMNYAYLLLIREEWGGGGAHDALRIIEDSYQYSPPNPLTYVLHIIALGYLGDLPGAEAKLKELKELAPNIELTKDTERWLNTQKEIAPKNTFLRIGNI